MASLGEKIKALRLAHGWSQPELAKKVGISQPSLHNIESGKTRTIRGATLAGLCRVLNVTPEVLLGNKRSVSEEAVLHEAEVVALWRSMSEDARAHVLAVARALARKSAGPPPSSPRGKAKTGNVTTTHGELTED